MVFYRISISSLLVALVALQQPCVLSQLNEILQSQTWMAITQNEPIDATPSPTESQLPIHIQNNSFSREIKELLSEKNALSRQPECSSVAQHSTFFPQAAVCRILTKKAASFITAPSPFISALAHFALPLRI